MNQVAPATVPESRAFPISAPVLVGANLVPLVGALAFQWTLFSILLLYWFENVIIGVSNVFRMALARPQESLTNYGKVLLIPFFVFHYGMFTTAHVVFLVAIFGSSSTVRELSDAGPALTWALVSMVFSHGFSFVRNYLMSGEYRRAVLPLLMFQPYARVMVLHVTILVGGFAVKELGSPLTALLILIGLKTGVDLAAHVAERRKFGTLGVVAP